MLAMYEDCGRWAGLIDRRWGIAESSRDPVTPTPIAAVRLCSSGRSVGCSDVGEDLDVPSCCH